MYFQHASNTFVCILYPKEQLPPKSILY